METSTTDTIRVICKRGVKRGQGVLPPGTTLDIPRAEFDAANIRSPGLYVLPGSEPDPVAEAEAAKAEQDAVKHAAKLRMLEQERLRREVESELRAELMRAGEKRAEAAKAAKAEADAQIVERAKARKARSQSAQPQV